MGGLREMQRTWRQKEYLDRSMRRNNVIIMGVDVDVKDNELLKGLKNFLREKWKQG